MTCHRLIRCSLAHALISTTSQVAVPVCIEHHRPGRRTRLRWQQSGPTHLSWVLELEQGANGVLAHLSAEPTGQPLTQLSRRAHHLALQLLVSRRLRRLAARAASTPV